METKKCMQCNAVLPVSEFSTDRRSKDGYRRVCKACAGVHECRPSGGVGTLYTQIVTKEGGNPQLKNFKPIELIVELRHRGYSGKLTFSKEIMV